MEDVRLDTTSVSEGDLLLSAVLRRFDVPAEGGGCAVTDGPRLLPPGPGLHNHAHGKATANILICRDEVGQRLASTGVVHGPLRQVHYIQPAEHRVGSMTLRLVQIAMNARDDSAVGRFWAEALGWGVSMRGEPGVTNLEPVGFAYPDPVAVCIDVVAVPETQDGEEPRAPRPRHHIFGPSGGPGRAAGRSRRDARRRGPGRRLMDRPGRPGGQRVLRPHPR